MNSSRRESALSRERSTVRHDEPVGSRHRLVLIHPLDPRGQKIGGIESHVRLMLEYAPPAWSVLFVGVDGQGDCQLGEITPMTFRGRAIDFLPVLFYPDDRIHQAAKNLSQSITMRFMLGLIRYLLAIKRAVGPMPASVELQRYEFALVPFLLGYPTVQMIHGEGRRDDKMDSLIKKYWLIHRLNEQVALRLAHRIVCVNPNILARLEGINSKLAQRASLMPVPVDTKVFQPQDFDVSDHILRVIFAGRLDEFKDPPTMFRVLARVHQLMDGACEFHYVGLTDPRRFTEFSLIESFSILHGFQSAIGVAGLMAQCHMGILTSFFEGMPCYLLELLAVGRPVAAIRLPQYDLVVEDGVSGVMIDRAAVDELNIEGLASRIVAMWLAIQESRMSPQTIHEKAVPYSVDRQFGAHFVRHGSLGR